MPVPTQGADQWGNMVGGYELVKSIHDVRTLSLTTPLLLSGETKMGKSNPSSQIWLDPNLTSPYQMFQYLIQRTDAESPQMLKSLTLCDNEVIEQVINDNSVRAVQKKLAQEVTKFVHGRGGLAEAEVVTRILHQKKPSFDGVTEENVSMVLRSVEMVECHDGDSCMADVLNKLQCFASIEVSANTGKCFCKPEGGKTTPTIIRKQNTTLRKKRDFKNAGLSYYKKNFLIIIFFFFIYIYIEKGSQFK